MNVGELKPVYLAAGEDCHQYPNIPFGVSDDHEYERSNIIKMIESPSCVWTVNLNPTLTKDVASDVLMINKMRAVQLHLARNRRFGITAVKQSELHAKADAFVSYDFTETMKMLSKANIFPPLTDDDCKYDLPSQQIRCAISVPLVYVNERWQIDASNIR